jgi:hypothetical protein
MVHAFNNISNESSLRQSKDDGHSNLSYADGEDTRRRSNPDVLGCVYVTTDGPSFSSNHLGVLRPHFPASPHSRVLKFFYRRLTPFFLLVVFLQLCDVTGVTASSTANDLRGPILGCGSNVVDRFFRVKGALSLLFSCCSADFQIVVDTQCAKQSCFSFGGACKAANFINSQAAFS